MKVLRESSYAEIETHLDQLGAFDRNDTRKYIEPCSHFYLIEIDESEFWSLVFLQSKEVFRIAPPGEDRHLRAVASRALGMEQKRLSANWDLDDVQRRAMDAEQMPAIVLRDLRDGEIGPQSFKYIHDGCHRCLGYSMLLATGDIQYSSLTAFLATNSAYAV